MTGTLRCLATEVRAATIGRFIPAVLRAPATWSSTRQPCALRTTTIVATGLRCVAQHLPYPRLRPSQRPIIVYEEWRL